MIHTTVGVYPNIDTPFKSNGVSSDILAEHIKYNLDYRPGRALFVDGICIHRGGISGDEMDIVQKKVNEIKHSKDTRPYH